MHFKNDLAILSAFVKATIDDENIETALQILSSEDKPAEDNDTTNNPLRTRHSLIVSDRRVSPSLQEYTALQVSKDAYKTLIRSFPADSSGKPDDISALKIF